MWRHIIESHSTSFDVLRVLCFVAYFTISVFDYTYWPCFEVKDEEDLLLEKTVRGYRTGRGNRQSKWLWNLWEQRMTPALACVAGGVVWVRDWSFGGGAVFQKKGVGRGGWNTAYQKTPVFWIVRTPVCGETDWSRAIHMSIMLDDPLHIFPN